MLFDRSTDTDKLIADLQKIVTEATKRTLPMNVEALTYLIDGKQYQQAQNLCFEIIRTLSTVNEAEQILRRLTAPPPPITNPTKNEGT